MLDHEPGAILNEPAWPSLPPMVGELSRRTQERWTARDVALWVTCDISSRLKSQAPTTLLPDLAVPFVLQLGESGREQVLSEGVLSLYAWTALSDGSFQRDNGFFFASGKGGLTLTAAVAGARALGNSAKEKQARADAQPRWVKTAQGRVFVSTHGFYLGTDQELLPIAWSEVQMIEIVKPGIVTVQGGGLFEGTRFRLQSDWAELLLVLWAKFMNPKHPQLVDRGWLPAGFKAWAARQGRALTP